MINLLLRIGGVTLGLFAQALWATPSQIAYIIEPFFEPGAPYYQVEILVPKAPASMRFIAPEWHVSALREPDVREQIIYDFIGDVASVENHESAFTVHMQEPGPLKISYRFFPDVRLLTPGYPFLLKEYFAWMADKLFAHPEGDETWDIFVSVRVPEDWQRSFPEELRVQAPFSQFLEHSFVAGKMQLSCDEQSPPTCLSFYAHTQNLEGQAQQYQEVVATLLAHQREFWGSDSNSPYWVHLYSTNSTGINGIHADQAMLLFLPIAEPHRVPLTLYALSHELLHQWIGTRILKIGGNTAVDRFVVKAFLEGITDYYGARFAREAGLIDEENMEAIMVRHKEQYLRHPSYGKPIAEVAKTNTFEHYLTPQMHLLIRRWLDTGLSQEALDTFIKSLPEEPMTKSALYETLGKRLGERYSTDVAAHIERGEPLSFSLPGS